MYCIYVHKITPLPRSRHVSVQIRSFSSWQLVIDGGVPEIVKYYLVKMFLSWTPLPPGNFPLGKCLTHTVNGEQRKRFTVVQPFSLPLVKTMFHCKKHSPHHLLLSCVTCGAKVHRFWHDKCCPCPHHPSLLCPKGSVAVSSWMWSASCRSLPVTSTTLCTFSLCQQSCSSTWARSPTPSRSEAYWEMLRRTCRYSNWSSPPPQYTELNLTS